MDFRKILSPNKIAWLKEVSSDIDNNISVFCILN